MFKLTRGNKFINVAISIYITGQFHLARPPNDNSNKLSMVKTSINQYYNDTIQIPSNG